MPQDLRDRLSEDQKEQIRQQAQETTSDGQETRTTTDGTERSITVEEVLERMPPGTTVSDLPEDVRERLTDEQLEEIRERTG